MKATDQVRNSRNGLVLRMTVALAMTVVSALVVAAQTDAPASTAQTALEPVIHDLRGVSIDMPLKDAKEKLGKPKVSDDTGLYYEFSDGESAQLGIDEDKKVRTIALIYSSDSSDTPTYAEMFGPQVPLEKKEDGSVYKMIRYPKAGFWLAYSRTGGKKPMTVITMRRIAKR